MNLKKFDIIFLCLAKNVEHTIKKLFDFHLKLNQNNINSLLIIGENNSEDNTLRVINEFSNKNKNTIYLDTSLINSYKNRIERLTHGRNYLKNFIFEKKYVSKFISIVDVDEVINCELDFKSFIGLLKNLEANKNELFGVSAKSKPYYYDMLNLFIEDYYEKDVLRVQTNKNLYKSYYLRKINIYKYQKKITNIKKNIKAISAHNGFCVYLYDDYISGNYLDIKDEESKQIIPEHLVLNNSIHQKTKKHMLVSNNFFVKTPREHMPYFKFYEFALNKFFQYFYR
ncbi:hypothetical protein [Candidatus Pelagibacter sp. HIMB1542]|uniref:hypothetical protein n=1 Tax=Candidatus Pelagibacter sp. HIMB1542 TaxID=3413346 RepID=UPI003F85F35E